MKKKNHYDNSWGFILLDTVIKFIGWFALWIIDGIYDYNRHNDK